MLVSNGQDLGRPLPVKVDALAVRQGTAHADESRVIEFDLMVAGAIDGLGEYLRRERLASVRELIGGAHDRPAKSPAQGVCAG